MSLGEQFASIGAKVTDEMRKSGLALAVVTNIEDPESLGRLKCRLVTENENVTETDWCFCMTPAGGNEYGFFFFPQIDDLVVLSYLGGDVHHPVVLGSYWAGEVVAPYSIEDGTNEIVSLKTPGGSELKFEDTSDAQKISVTTPSGATIVIDDGESTLSIKGDSEDNALIVKWADGEIELKAATKITLSAGDTTITLESSGNLSGDASSTVSFSGANVEMTADSEFAASGMTSKVSASGQLTLEASGTAKLSGAMVQIN